MWLQRYLSCSGSPAACLLLRSAAFNNAWNRFLTHWTSLKVTADDSFDLVKSDSALLDPYLAPVVIASLQFISLSLPAPPLLLRTVPTFFPQHLSHYVSPPIPIFLYQEHICHQRASSSESLALTGCASSMLFEKAVLRQTVLLPLCAKVLHIYGTTSWMVDGWRLVVSYIQAQIHNLWR